MIQKTPLVCLYSPTPAAVWLPAWQKALEAGGHAARLARGPHEFTDALMAIVDEAALQSAPPSESAMQLPLVVLVRQPDDDAMARAAAAGALLCLPLASAPAVAMPFVTACIDRLARLQVLQRAHDLLVESLTEARTVGTGMGVLIERHGLLPDEALQALRRHARRHRRRLVDLVADVTTGDVFPVGQPPNE
jgi:AmiR/NasT family two-component response regulator